MLNPRYLPVATAAVVALSLAALRLLPHARWPGLALPTGWAALLVVAVVVGIGSLPFPLITEGRLARFYLVAAALGAVWIAWGGPLGVYATAGLALPQAARCLIPRRTVSQDRTPPLQAVTDILLAGALSASVVAWFGPDRVVASGIPVAVTLIALVNLGSLALVVPHMPVDQRRGILRRRTVWRDALVPSVSTDLLGILILLAGVHWLGVFGFALGGGMLWWISTRLRLTLLAAAQRAPLADAPQEARRDSLTGLANRAGLLEYADQITQAGLPCVVAIVDVDHFKAVNDTYGHAAGDAVLTLVAHRLEAACRRQRAEWPDLVGRWGGEEFVLLLPRLPEAVAPGRVEAMRAAISATPIRWEHQVVTVTASVGATLCLHTPLDLLKAVEGADGALYAAKEDGRDCTVWTAWPVVGA